MGYRGGRNRNAVLQPTRHHLLAGWLPDGRAVRRRTLVHDDDTAVLAILLFDLTRRWRLDPDVRIEVAQQVSLLDVPDHREVVAEDQGDDVAVLDPYLTFGVPFAIHAERVSLSVTIDVLSQTDDFERREEPADPEVAWALIQEEPVQVLGSAGEGVPADLDCRRGALAEPSSFSIWADATGSTRPVSEGEKETGGPGQPPGAFS